MDTNQIIWFKNCRTSLWKTNLNLFCNQYLFLLHIRNSKGTPAKFVQYPFDFSLTVIHNTILIIQFSDLFYFYNKLNIAFNFAPICPKLHLGAVYARKHQKNTTKDKMKIRERKNWKSRSTINTTSYICT